MADVRKSPSIFIKFAALAIGCFVVAAGFLGTAQPAHAFGTLTGASVVPAATTTGASGNVVVSFTTAGAVANDGKIEIVFPTGFTFADGGPSNVTGNTYNGTTYAVSGPMGPTVLLVGNAAGTGLTTSNSVSITISNVKVPTYVQTTGTYAIATKDAADTLIDNVAAAGTSITAAALSGSVTQASLVVGAAGNVTVNFTTTNSLQPDDKVVVTFGSVYDITTNPLGVTCASLTGGTVAITDVGQIATIARMDGDILVPGAYSCIITGIINNLSGTTGAYTISTTAPGDQIRDTNAAIAANALTVANPNAIIEKATAISGSTGSLTLTLDLARSLVVSDKINITFPASYTVAQTTASISGASISCVFGAATLGVTAASQVLTLTVAGSDRLDAGTGCAIVVPGVDAIPQYADSTDIVAFTIQNSSGVGISTGSGVTLTNTTAAALTATNVAPGGVKAGTTNTATVTFTTANSIPVDGLIYVTFGSGFTVPVSPVATCSTMNGNFAAAGSGQVVTITRSIGSDGTIQTAGAETCTISLIRNSSSVGTTGVYAISTAIASGALIDSDLAVTADSITSASSTVSDAVPLTYSISLSAPVAAAAYLAGNSIAITWSTAGTGAVSVVNLDYSTDGGITYTAIVSSTPNDGSYTWTAPSIAAQSVTIRAQGTDLVTVLATDTSDAFSIGSTSTTPVEPTDTSGTSTTLLPTGTYMKGASWSTVYYIDGSTRRPFLDSQTYFTYTDSFDGVIDVADDYLANYTMGTPMLPKAGTVLVKIQSINNVYALTEDSTLRWITSESLASSLYGGNWADFVIDVPVTAWGHFTIGESITSTSDISVDRSILQTRSALNSK